MAGIATDSARLPQGRSLSQGERKRNQRAAKRPDRIPHRAGVGPAPLSFAQERLWFLEQFEPGSSAYNEMQVTRMTGALQLDALERSLDCLAARHDSLRLHIGESHGSPFQDAPPLPPVHVPLIDLRDTASEKRMAVAWSRLEELRRQSFDLAVQPLWRVIVVRMEKDEYLLARIVHHIGNDGWSNGIFWRELSHFYAAFSRGDTPAPLPDLPITYRDFSAWQRDWLQGERLTDLVDYWRERLKGLQPLELPYDRPRPRQPSHQGAIEHFELDQQLTDSLRALASGSRTTPYMLLLTAFQVLLHRYSGQDDIAVGSPIANRMMPELEGLIGLFANTLVMRTDCSGNPTFRSLLADVRQNAMQAYGHQDLPFEKLVEELRPSRLLNRNPLFDVMFAFQNMPSHEFKLPGLECERMARAETTSKFDLSVFFHRTAKGLSGRFEYATDLFDAATIRRMVGHFRTLLESVVADPDCPIDELSLLTTSERRKLLNTWNATTVDVPSSHMIFSRTVCDLFDERVSKTPDGPAIEFAESSLSYGELAEQANRFAHALQEHGVGPNIPVGIFVDQSPTTYVALLAILKAGGSYVPFDRQLPADRVSWMISQVRPSVFIVGDQAEQDLLPDDESMQALFVSGPVRADLSAEPPPSSAGANDAAYLLFTSGSTGRPKAVAVPHRTLTNLTTWQQRHERLSQPARTLQVSSLTFDVSLQEILTTWISGGTLVVPPSELRREPRQMLRFLTQHRIERLFVPYVLLQGLAESAEASSLLPASMKDIVSAGERLQLTPPIRSLMTKLPACRLHNHYGPTESHVVTAHTLDGRPETWPPEAPIGRSISNTQIYLLDDHLQPVPIGVPGMLYIGGAGVALGYVNEPELTAESFVPHPFPPDTEQSAYPVVYRSGDLARYRADGTIEFMGRADRQLKIRGYRVEPGEVEAALREHPAVGDCVVGEFGDETIHKRLVAWWVGALAAPESSVDLRDFLAQRLPDYMLPAAFVQMDALPLTPSGKVDNTQLPAPDRSLRTVANQRAETALEVQLLAIWRKTLGTDHVGPEDDFFALGGHSLLAVRLLARVAKATGRELPVASLFYGPSVRQQAQLLVEDGWLPPWKFLVPVQPGGARPPLFLVPPASGTSVRFGPLAQYLGSDQPLFSFDPAGFDGTSPPHETVEEMAAAYVAELMCVQPTGPYLLGGMCFGAHVALAMAQKLYASGEAAPSILAFDASHPHNGPTWSRPKRTPFYVAKRLVRHIRKGTVPRRIRRFIRYASTTGRVRLRHRLAPHGAAKDRVWAAHIRAQRTYRAQPFPGKVVLFQSDEFANAGNQVHWQELAEGGIETIHFSNTSHRSLLLEDEHIGRIAEELRRYVDWWMANHWTGRSS